MINDELRIKFERWLIETHTKRCIERGLYESKDHVQLVDGVNKYLVKKFKDGEYKDDEIEGQWRAYHAAHAEFMASLVEVTTDTIDSILTTQPMYVFKTDG